MYFETVRYERAQFPDYLGHPMRQLDAGGLAAAVAVGLETSA